MTHPVWTTCPIPIDRYPVVTMAHGGGGRLMNQLIERLFHYALSLPDGDQRHDGAVVELEPGPLAVSTDSFVVQPLCFPGGSIGSLAVYGTANDVAMCGARPRYLTLSMILEEGLPISTLWREVLAIAQACREAGVRVVTGDTKVVERGKGDGMFINTTGVGRVVSPIPIGPASVAVGDAILISGDLGRHGMAVMAAREGMALEVAIESDCGSLVAPALALIEAGVGVHCMRDLTRGGLASALNEIAVASGSELHLEEAQLRVREDVRSVCEIFGLDPLYVANEGRFAIVVPEPQAGRALEVLHRFEISAGATLAGMVREARGPAMVVVHNRYGAEWVVDMLSGEQLPRIC